MEDLPRFSHLILTGTPKGPTPVHDSRTFREVSAVSRNEVDRAPCMGSTAGLNSGVSDMSFLNSMNLPHRQADPLRAEITPASMEDLHCNWTGDPQLHMLLLISNLPRCLPSPWGGAGYPVTSHNLWWWR